MNEELDKTSQNAMSIIMLAGDAREECKLAYDAIATQDMTEAQRRLSLADGKIAKAHQIQTDAIQATIRGEKQDYNLLFAHAQDTLMTIYSEIIVAHHLVKVFASLDARVKKLEERDG